MNVKGVNFNGNVKLDGFMNFIGVNSLEILENMEKDYILPKLQDYLKENEDELNNLLTKFFW